MSISLNWSSGDMTIGEYTGIQDVGEGVEQIVMRHAGGKNCRDFGSAFDFTDHNDVKNRWVTKDPDTVTATSYTSSLSVTGGGGALLQFEVSAISARSQLGTGITRPLKKIYTEADNSDFMTITKPSEMSVTSGWPMPEIGLFETDFVGYQTANYGVTTEYQYAFEGRVTNANGDTYTSGHINTTSGSSPDFKTVLANAITSFTLDYLAIKGIYEASSNTYRIAVFEGSTSASVRSNADAWTSGSASALTGYVREGSLVDSSTMAFSYQSAGHMQDTDAALTNTFKLAIYGCDSSCAFWYAPHYGNANDCGLWNKHEVPDTAGETLNGWTFTLDGGAASSGELKHDHAEFTIARENSDTKVFGYTHDTDQNITQDSLNKYIFGKFQFDANNVDDAWRYGFFNSTTNDCATNGHSIASNTSGNFFTCIGGVAGNTTTSTFTVDTDYWLRLEINNGTSYLDVFNASATRSEVDAGRGLGDFASLSRDISSATISCDEIGLRNTNRTGANSSMTMRGYETEGNAHADHADGLHDGWYPDVEFDFNQQALGVSSAYTFNYSTFAVSSTGSNILYSRRLDTTGDSSLDFTGDYNGETATASLSNEDGYEMAWKCNFDPTELSSAVSLASITAAMDELAPDVDYLFVRKNTTLASYAVGYQMSDDGAIKYGEIRYSPDGGTTLYIVDWNGTTKKRVGTAFASYTSTNSYKIANEGDTQAVLTPAGQYDETISLVLANLGLSASATLLIQVRATDAADNQSGWVTATEFGTGLTEVIRGANEMELLRIIAAQTA